MDLPPAIKKSRTGRAGDLLSPWIIVAPFGRRVNA